MWGFAFEAGVVASGCSAIGVAGGARAYASGAGCGAGARAAGGLLGPTLTCLSDCAECGTTVESDVDVASLLGGARGDQPASTVRAHGGRRAFRMPLADRTGSGGAEGSSRVGRDFAGDLARPATCAHRRGGAAAGPSMPRTDRSPMRAERLPAVDAADRPPPADAADERPCTVAPLSCASPSRER